MDALQLLIKGTVVVFVVSTMLSIGLAARSTEIIAPLRRPAKILRALVGSFVLAPMAALAIVKVLQLEPGYELGLLLLAFAAGSPLLPKLAESGRTDVAGAVALMVLLMASSIVVMPLALPLLVTGLQLNPWHIAAPLIILMLAPLLLGNVWQRFAPQTGARLLPAITKTSNIGLIAVVILLCGTNFAALVGVLGSGAIGAAILFVVLLFVGGWALAEPNRAERRLLGLATAARNTGAALVIAESNAVEPKAIIMLIVTAVVGLVLLLAIATWIGRRDRIGSASGTKT